MTNDTPRFFALRSPVSLLLFLLTASAGVALDQWSKVEAVQRLSYPGDDGTGVRWNSDHTEVVPITRQVYQFIPGYLHFEFIPNRGAVFGIGQGQRMLFMLVSVAAIFFIFYLFIVSGRQRFYQLILGMLLAGVLGNLYDRFQFSYVRDMIHALPSVHALHGREIFPYIFNVADSLLCVGVFLMIVHSLFQSPKQHKPVGNG